MGIETVAIYSEADRNALHIVLADYAVPMSGSTPAETYLNIDAILKICREMKVDGVHPGYGFLAENSKFIKALAKAHIKFIGPGMEAAELLGNKVKARAHLSSQGIPVVQGTPAISDYDDALKAAKELGTPIIIKAAGGGGGRGMRIVRDEEQFESSFHSAQSEAETAFGNPEVFLERYIENPKHIEIQIVADGRGKVVHLGERDCSIQRRFQKLVEEAPSPVVTPELREQMGETAVKIAMLAGYESAGTIEFIVDEGLNFYFMEANTRLQVEHPVTEMITGTDIVREQMRIASGEPLSLKQEDIRFDGHAIECRINAEDPYHNFLPSLGTLNRYIVPSGNGVRLDSGAYEGYTIPQYYDSLIAKLIVHSDTREGAIEKMKRALGEYIITGISTTIPFHLFILDHPVFRAGKATTKFIDDYFTSQVLVEAEKREEMTETREAVAVAAMVAHYLESAKIVKAAQKEKKAKEEDRWKALNRLEQNRSLG